MVQSMGALSKQRQSRQFSAACTEVARPSLEPLRDGRHPMKGFRFRDTRKVMAEVFALAAHTPSCIVRQESRRLMLGYDAMSCTCVATSE